MTARLNRYSTHRQAGVSLITAIFLLVVLAGLGVAIVAISSSQQASSAMDQRGARANQAARAGVEWGLYQQLRRDSCAPSSSLALPAPTLAPFTVTVQCVSTATPATGAAGASPAAPVATTVVAGSAAVSGIANTAILLEGMRVSGIGIVPGTRIANISGTSSLTLTIAATGNGVQALTYRSALDRWQLTATACTEPVPATGRCPNPAPTTPDYMQRVLQVQF